MPGSTKLVQGGCAAGRRTCAAAEGADAGGRGLAHAVLPAAFECRGILSLHTSHMKPSTCDIRLPMLAVALLPLGLWGLALVVLILQWPGPRGFIDSFALLVSGGYAIRQGMSWMHRLAGGFLPNGFVASPAVNFLLFELEDAATADKLKLWGDEVGCIFPRTIVFACIPPNAISAFPTTPFRWKLTIIKGRPQGSDEVDSSGR